jgi:penicillin amidase
VESALAKALLPVFLAAKPDTEGGRQALALARGWDGTMRADAAAPLLFNAWYRELTRLVYADELRDLFTDFWDYRAAFMIAVMTGNASAWCDDVTTPETETCPQLASRAMDLAAADLAKRFGPEAGWRWGEAHQAASDHRPFGAVPWLARWFNLPVPTPGDTYSVNVGHTHLKDDARPFANRHAASLRAIYDLADLDRSLFMHSTGQSGNRLSPFYGNFVERWAAVDYFTIPTKREAIADPRRLLLVPPPPAR